jgi:transcriptional regulator with XRE-family HTH domain
MSTHSQLGDYLRARRELVQPADFGLPVLGQRRVAGLRREEVAMLAGISSDYYLRLEQGRDHNPSVQVLESLARVLRLDETATGYLIGLAAPPVRSRARRQRRDTVPAGILQLVASLGTPAFVESRHFDVLAANDLARAVSPNLRVGVNRMRAMFLDPAEQALCPNHEQAMAHLVAAFRQSIGTDVDDPRAAQVVGELSLASERFRRLWARHDVHTREGSQTAMYHPQVGELALHKERLAITDGDTDGLVLVVYHVVPGTGSAEKLSLLASLAAPSPSVEPRIVLDAEDGSATTRATA